ncbi:MAG: dihydrodipicolinate synthase family protein, partial [Bacteroidales bacterium]|nr:dihydrodipicolinate synthase family protein [Bacteroidales bacterium]
MREKLKGIIPALASPCDSNDIFLENKFSSLVEDLGSCGVHGFFACGGTGDGSRMTLAERKTAVEITVDIAAKRSQNVIAHVGTNNTRDSIELALHAAKTGVDAVSCMPPSGLTQKQLVAYYSEIVQSFGKGVLVYHIPVVTGYSFTLDQMLELLDIEG